MFKTTWAYVGLVIVILFVVVAMVAPYIAPYNPYAIDLAGQIAPPTSAHWLGQDGNGADILSRLLIGARISLEVAAIVVTISALFGVIIGLISGYFGGIIDLIIMRLVDILLAFPGLLLAIALVAVLGPALQNVIIALTVLGWVPYARLTRGQVIAIKEREFVLAAQISGQSHVRIMRVHVLPNVLAPIIVQATFSVAGVIIAESSLSFLGLGVAPGTPSWGAMLNDGKQVLLSAPHVSVFPGLAIMLVVLAFNFLGDGLREKMDPRIMKR